MWAQHPKRRLVQQRLVVLAQGLGALWVVLWILLSCHVCLLLTMLILTVVQLLLLVMKGLGSRV
jgi:hypothetical protein